MMASRDNGVISPNILVPTLRVETIQHRGIVPQWSGKVHRQVKLPKIFIRYRLSCIEKKEWFWYIQKLKVEIGKKLKHALFYERGVVNFLISNF